MINEFGQKYYENFIYVNLETNRGLAANFEKDISPKRIIACLEVYFEQNIILGKMLIFFDEIQASARVQTALNYFAEDAP